VVYLPEVKRIFGSFRVGSVSVLYETRKKLPGVLSEPIALNVYNINYNKGTISFKIKISGKSTKLLPSFKLNRDEIWLMGPVGTKKADHQQQVLAPMQCMMQGVCGECLMITKKGKYFFACQQPYIATDEYSENIANCRMQQNRILELLG
ncbi:MAG: hypothetical protein AAF153_02560, partial [Pseudomonadota bacterium]